MKLLHLIRSLDPATGGPSEGVRQSCLAHARLGHVCDVGTLDAIDASWLSDFPANVHALGSSRFTYGFSLRFAKWLSKNVEIYDAVIVHGMWQYHGLAAWNALRRSTCPYFIFPHGMLDPWFKRTYPVKHLKKWLYWQLFEGRVCRAARALLFTTAEEAALAPESFSLSGTRSIVVGYGIEPPSNIRSQQTSLFLAAFPACANKRLILFLSRIHPKKGCDMLLKAFSNVAHRDPALHLVIAGPDEVGLQPQLEAIAADAGISDRVTWTGMLGGDLKWGALQAAEVFALFSHQENFGIVIAESLAVGRPVLITKCVNTWQTVRNEHAGLVGEDTLESGINLLNRWLDLGSDARDAMGEKARACFLNHFHIDASAKNLIRTIQQLQTEEVHSDRTRLVERT